MTTHCLDNLSSSQQESPPAAVKAKAREKKGFESRPLFIKAGLYHYTKYENVRKQSVYQRLVVCELLKTNGNTLFNEEKTQAAIHQYEQVFYPIY